MSNRLRITVLGAGSWGTTLAILLHENEHEVRLWEYFPEQAEAVADARENAKFLPGIGIPKSIHIGSDLDAALADSELVLFVVPTHTMRETARAVAATDRLRPDSTVVNASKGLEEHTMKRMSEVLADELPVEPGNIYSLIGPSHAEEVSRKIPTSVVIAGEKGDRINRIQRIFFRPYFRVYTNYDVVGSEIGVALKNIIAIAAGVCDGLGYGDNTKAALLSRGLVEISRLGCALGARRETFFGLSGVGDLIVTALSRHSRNRYVGERIGKGEPLDAVLNSMVMVAEGIRTTRAAVELGKKMDVELPIIKNIYKVLFNGKDPKEAIIELMNRPPREEMW
ncbi:MAG: NAD(P)H-dependent glycerol-3-phosphate dehydrogenase [Candidatus Latescibacteria bacterium]|nr:NAD(P)H-dependent glycerol-3-phosphate dehydrogenase [Candidatus Latescibacterota bacterium]NIM21318.1 NAD(P)H-dependent glycerol-3-phosphate dehydrogenase [Candidatus Latescibacterota bacterium]NIM65499.1 NAD(P)H-dependent glycerol-3-phosphate dehydrogenase [Candidatus Latescibacterota bacterium]NIO01879.1 NAD(P)H-dependent glycerol-3-phosphate dehydrogenase [Candidatus Latescibacterota bacterium]NIO28692.1 NAD(P)H-dependent glycerol-3-phosphate dehydrogenase [Candidatus Latescibacterota ba